MGKGRDEMGEGGREGIDCLALDSGDREDENRVE